MNEYQIGPWKYCDCEALVSGDYAPGGTVATANQRSIDRMIEAGELTSAGSYGGTEVLRSWGPPDPDVIDDIDGADVIILTWAYGGRQYLIREDGSDAARGILAGLDSYPLIDESELSEVESEREREAWDSYLCDEVRRALPDDDTRDRWDDLDSDASWSLFCRAMNEACEYLEHLPEGPYMPRRSFERVVDALTPLF